MDPRSNGSADYHDLEEQKNMDGTRCRVLARGNVPAHVACKRNSFHMLLTLEQTLHDRPGCGQRGLCSWSSPTAGPVVVGLQPQGYTACATSPKYLDRARQKGSGVSATAALRISGVGNAGVTFQKTAELLTMRGIGRYSDDGACAGMRSRTPDGRQYNPLQRK